MFRFVKTFDSTPGRASISFPKTPLDWLIFLGTTRISHTHTGDGFENFGRGDKQS